MEAFWAWLRNYKQALLAMATTSFLQAAETGYPAAGSLLPERPAVSRHLDSPLQRFAAHHGQAHSIASSAASQGQPEPLRKKSALSTTSERFQAASIQSAKTARVISGRRLWKGINDLISVMEATSGIGWTSRNCASIPERSMKKSVSPGARQKETESVKSSTRPPRTWSRPLTAPRQKTATHPSSKKHAMRWKNIKSGTGRTKNRKLKKH